MTIRRLRAVFAGCLGIAAVFLAISAGAAEKLILPKDAPNHLTRLDVARDGSRVYLAGRRYFIVDQEGTLLDRFGAPEGCVPRDMIPLPDGWFLGCHSHFEGKLALHRPDGSEARKLVGRGIGVNQLRTDGTGATSPCGAAVDVGAKRIFAIDCTMAPGGTPSPDWSRIVSFDLEGKYLGDMHRYDAKDPAADDGLRTWFCDVAVDPARRLVYALAGRNGDILAFDYDGHPKGRARGVGLADTREGGLAVFADGRVALGQRNAVQVFGPGLDPIRKIDVPPALGNILDVDADAGGKLYAVVDRPGTWFLRWEADLTTPRVFGVPTLSIGVEFPSKVVEAGAPLNLKVTASGRLGGPGRREWHALARPADGSNLDWRSLPARERGGELILTTPPTLRGLYEIAARYGEGTIDGADLAADPYLSQVVSFVPRGATRSLSAFTADGRRAYRQGEPIPVQVVRRGAGTNAARARLELRRGSAVVAATTASVGSLLAGELPASLTRRLPAGRYRLVPEAAGHATYAVDLDLATASPDSPMQRILYHEFGRPIADLAEDLPGVAERLAFFRDYARASAALGFTRETDRYLGRIAPGGPTAWRRGTVPADVSAPGIAPADYYGVPPLNVDWASEAFLDQAVRRGLSYDSQLFTHCGTACFRDPALGDSAAILRRSAQWFGRYPSFYGFNYNDELFFGTDKKDTAWLDTAARDRFPGGPRADALDLALRTMYERLNAAVRQVDPAARVTATPMWQYPAVEGSYAPNIYRGMSESYTHYLSEGYHLPWYPAHSVESLRRPGLPLMGVFDNISQAPNGDAYLKNAMQVLGRGVQGIGVEHTVPFENSITNDALRVANLLAKLYGPVFAEAPPANEANVLYSRTQDVTEHREVMGTPHWERAFAMVGACLMAGLPAGLAYEEDVAAGSLLQGGRPRAPMLLLTGQSRPLPAAVKTAIAAYVSAGGRVFADADSAPFPDASRLDVHAHVLKGPMKDGYAGDSLFPYAQAPMESLAAALAAALGPYRRFPIDTDDPWISKNGFDGGAVRYVMLASETSPYPWDPGDVWGLGANFTSTYQPKTVSVHIPWGSGVLYDVFDHALLRPTLAGGKATFDADLTTAPGRLFAIAPTPLGAPKLNASVEGDAATVTIRYRVEVVDEQGHPLAARVPIRIRFLDGNVALSEQIRGTGPDGAYSGELPLPAPAGPWTLEVTELLGGKGTTAALSARVAMPALMARRADVEPLHPDRLRALIAEAAGTLNLVLPKGVGSPPEALAAGLKAKGITLNAVASLPKEAVPGVYLALGVFPKLAAADQPDDLAWLAWSRGLLPYPASPENPGPGRGFFAPAFSPRADREHAIVLIGSDGPGLGKTVEAFLAWLGTPTPALTPIKPAPLVGPTAGTAASVAPVPRLSDVMGARLNGVVVAPEGKHLALSAEGYANNVAVVEDQGDRGRVVRASRVGQAPTAGSLFVSADGRSFGASSRTTSRVGEAFHLIAAETGAFESFASFGDSGRRRHEFAASDRGDVVLTPGPCGVICWRREGAGKTWGEAWAIDFWKKFPGLNWPIDPLDERLPLFQASIPRGADYALILEGETTDNGWITNEHPAYARLSAVALADGKERWAFDVPVPRTLLLPELRTSPDGSRVMLLIKMGSFGKSDYRCYSLAGGKAVGSWVTPGHTLASALADKTRLIAQAYKGRLLEVRRADGVVLQSRTWPDQPTALAFAPDGLGLCVADDAGHVTFLDARGLEVWQADPGCRCALAARGDRLYAAGRDGRLRAFGLDGRLHWTLDCTPAMNVPRPMRLAADALEPSGPTLHRPRRPPTTSAAVPDGPNLLRTGQATLSLGGVLGWMSTGKTLIAPERLTDGRREGSAWLSLAEQFWDGTTGRQVWAEIAFKTPTDVRALTVYEDQAHPEAWPTDGLVQVWDEPTLSWKTAARGTFLDGPLNTYVLDLKKVTKIRYVPWESYFRNLYTCEIEVR